MCRDGFPKGLLRGNKNLSLREIADAPMQASAPAAVKEYNKTVEYLHLNPTRSGLACCPQDWRWSSFNEYAGVTSEEQNQRCGLIIDRVLLPSDERTRI